MTRISGRYLGRRLIVSYLTLLIIMSLLFLLIHSMPGSFISSMITPSMSHAKIEQIRQNWGLNQPLWKQYIQFMINYQTGQFGQSPTMHTSVWQLIARRMPRTLILFGAALIVGHVVGPIVGIYLGWKRGSSFDKSVFSGSLMLYSIPAFWISWLFIWVFNYTLHWLPSAYMLTQFPANGFQWTAMSVMVDALKHITLPLIAISSVGWVGVMLIMRPSMNNVTNEDYVFLARAKGLSERTVMLKHAARNALIPVATNTVIALAFIIDGAVIIENVFSWPGMGQLIVNAVLNRDYPTAQAAFFMLAILIVLARLLTDVVYTYLDPRIKFGDQG